MWRTPSYTVTRFYLRYTVSCTSPPALAPSDSLSIVNPIRSRPLLNSCTDRKSIPECASPEPQLHSDLHPPRAPPSALQRGHSLTAGSALSTSLHVPLTGVFWRSRILSCPSPRLGRRPPLPLLQRSHRPAHPCARQSDHRMARARCHATSARSLRSSPG